MQGVRIEKVLAFLSQAVVLSEDEFVNKNEVWSYVRS